MKVPRPSIPLLGSATALLLGLLLLPLAAHASGPAPQQRILLSELGFQPLNSQFLLNGSSMLTLHYVDDKHLLVTFTFRRLLPRVPDDPVDDQDRNIDALLLDLPSGKVLARTSWRVHDHGQYLWNLGGGNFLLRVRDTLTTFSPLANLPSGQPFAQHPFLTSDHRRIAAILLSPDDDLMMVESVRPPTPEERHEALLGPIASDASPSLKPRNPVQISFYRIVHQGTGIRASFAGVAHSPHTGDIAANAAGFLAVLDQGHQHYAFDFHDYNGRVNELSPFDSTCRPVPILVSRGEFIAFGCHAGQGMHVLGGFNMRGEENWEQNLFGDYLAPSLAFAPSTGRFALSRILTRSPFIADEPISSDLVSSQTVVVFQASSGRQLFKIDCAPIARAGQNFTLAPDGLSVAVIRADAIEIYALPPLTGKEQTAFTLAQAAAPKETDAPIQLSTRTETAAESTDADSLAADSPAADQTTDSQTPNSKTPDSRSSTPGSTPPTAAPTKPDQPAEATAPPTSTPSASPATQSAPADPDPDQPRKPPTLYTLPTDNHPASPTEPTNPQ